jgi:hypothetical protein
MNPAPKRLIVVVEGQTESNFVNRVLRSHLLRSGIAATATIVGKAKAADRGRSGPGVRGGNGYADWKRDIRNCLNSNRGQDFWLTTLCDLYGLPDDFPGWAPQAGDQDTAARCDRLEQALKNDIDDWRFSPYIQRHEFEALVLAAQDCLGDLFDADDQLSGLAMLRSEVAGMAPEEINDSPTTAPSKRLLRRIPGYRKAEDGPDAIELAGLPSVRSQCPRFDAWLTGLELWGTFE